MRRECIPCHRVQRKPLVSDPGMHHGTCVTHVPWRMSGSLTRRGGENVPGLLGASAISNFSWVARGPWTSFLAMIRPDAGAWERIAVNCMCLQLYEFLFLVWKPRSCATSTRQNKEPFELRCNLLCFRVQFYDMVAYIYFAEIITKHGNTFLIRKNVLQWNKWVSYCFVMKLKSKYLIPS